MCPPTTLLRYTEKVTATHVKTFYNIYTNKMYEYIIVLPAVHVKLLLFGYAKPKTCTMHRCIYARSNCIELCRIVCMRIRLNLAHCP